MTQIAVNWNEQKDGFTHMMWLQNLKQMWQEKEFVPSGDKNTWYNVLSESQRSAYKRVLQGLTLLDTRQGSEGMPLISLKVKDEQRKAVLAFMGMMEHMHAKSYSTIFSTLLTTQEIKDLFEWGLQQENLQYKADRIVEIYKVLEGKVEVTDEELYQAMVASTLLESFLFYSGFFYPLYLAGQGLMTKSGEIINLIIRDEAIHGVYVGQLAQELFNSFDAEVQERMTVFVYELLQDLMQNELAYTLEIYTEIDLETEVVEFLMYNANKALQNLGFPAFYPDVEINPIVENGLSTQTKSHDMFSMKGNGYVMATNVEQLTDEDFDFSDVAI